MVHQLFIAILFCLLTLTLALYKGDKCTVDSSNGQCTPIEECPSAKEKLLSKSGVPSICGFDNRTPIVCCPISFTPRFKSRISAEKCAEYNKRQILHYIKAPRYPRKLFTNQNMYAPAIAHGQDAVSKEFPHMALLGYGNRPGNIQWLCGGSLISEDFILTAGHCVYAKEHGKVQWVRLGELDIIDTREDAQPEDFVITNIFKHPQYKPPSHYHDIALLKLERKVIFCHGCYVQPACLYTSFDNPSRMTVTGWGQTYFSGDTSSRLQKVEINHVDHYECSDAYKTTSKRKLQKGILDKIQICAGDDDGKDTCHGDSGGPLQIQVPSTTKVLKHFEIVGITSFGKACGVDRTVGVYVRVAPYVPWIEKIVWG